MGHCRLEYDIIEGDIELYFKLLFKCPEHMAARTVQVKKRILRGAIIHYIHASKPIGLVNLGAEMLHLL